MKKCFLGICCFLAIPILINAQQISPTPDQIKKITAEWTGERFPDGRPKVPDALLQRLENISMEEAWGYLRNKGYHNQYENDWILIHEDEVMTGRALTAQFMPLRPDADAVVKEIGKEEGRVQSGGTNSWPIDVLQEGDIYVADSYGKIVDGTLIGDNLGNAIYTKSKKGVIFYGSVRDMAGLSEIEGFNGWVKGHDPSYIQQMMLSTINYPIRIGRASVLPGDAVLANKWGVIFIPAHLLADLVINSEFIMLRDKFGIQRLKEGKYSPGEIDSRWSETIVQDFLQWINTQTDLPMSREELDEFLKDRNW
ncbi:5-carboxymethyl-2-hydroxymuconate delta-isomerase [Indibacter alkaliphilus LW1]|uniref:5-carboxymethyl-2-hydroxymuconate delta-isomerase n=1 Tax=Indibacter alkaliphilus (strain CCUG 57479 / KCTC 22604 / LW1) TaxID=1189612 RepID=S2DTL6_INDAL|nr:demethylmenaquinone methyltransferase [Indibacter alkaliphilus]EOZ93173.1 5-carboxymethyl-2-hydroxymuconate delta-isomerase [Indibacter alkaliphilus LW1]